MQEREAHKPKLRWVWSDKDVHFTGALNQNAKEDESLCVDSEKDNIGINTMEIVQVCVQSEQNLDWNIMLWGSNGYDNTDLDKDYFIDYIKFSKAMGRQIGGANQWYYGITNVSVGYYDRDGLSQIHLSLANKSSTAKIAGASGAVRIGIAFRADGSKPFSQ